jgi:hypothetical protein
VSHVRYRHWEGNTVDVEERAPHVSGDMLRLELLVVFCHCKGLWLIVTSKRCGWSASRWHLRNVSTSQLVPLPHARSSTTSSCLLDVSTTIHRNCAACQATTNVRYQDNCLSTVWYRWTGNAHTECTQNSYWYCIDAPCYVYPTILPRKIHFSDGPAGFPSES